VTPPIPFVANPDYRFTGEWLAALRRAMPGECIMPLDDLDAAAKAESMFAVVINPLPEDVRQLPRLEWVHSVWAGVERLVTDLADTELKIVRLIDPQLADTMAEAVLAWTLYLHRDMPLYAVQQRNRTWMPLDYTPAQEKTVALLGLGALGEAAARRLLEAGFNVCGWSRTRKTLAGVECFAGEPELPAMLAKANILVCLLPLTAGTNGLLNAERLSHIPPGASLINFARGSIIPDGALRTCLDDHRVKHAVLDVFSVEPLPPEAWQWAHPCVTVLPHISAPTDRRTASAIIARNIDQYRKTGQIPEHVDRTRGY
jgi:glyoxylate/hydroxypyruvate reductase A